MNPETVTLASKEGFTRAFSALMETVGYTDANIKEDKTFHFSRPLGNQAKNQIYPRFHMIVKDPQWGKGLDVAFIYETGEKTRTRTTQTREIRAEEIKRLIGIFSSNQNQLAKDLEKSLIDELHFGASHLNIDPEAAERYRSGDKQHYYHGRKIGRTLNRKARDHKRRTEELEEEASKRDIPELGVGEGALY